MLWPIFSAFSTIRAEETNNCCSQTVNLTGIILLIKLVCFTTHSLKTEGCKVQAWFVSSWFNTNVVREPSSGILCMIWDLLKSLFMTSDLGAAVLDEAWPCPEVSVHSGYTYRPGRHWPPSPTKDRDTCSSDSFSPEEGSVTLKEELW